MMQSISEFFSTLSYESLIEEVITTPKPGLVDMASSGAHVDMDIKTFIDSSHAISPYLGEMAEFGYRSNGSDEEIFQKIREIGINAERAMYKATNGINTHKGAIFSLGILVTAAGCLLREKQVFSIIDLFERSKTLCKDYIYNYLLRIKAMDAPSTNGEKFYCQKGISGARGEAMNGFSSVQHHSLPVLKEMIDADHSFNDAKVQALLVLMKKIDDTTVLSRVGSAGLRTMQISIEGILQNGGVGKTENIDSLYQLDDVFTKNNMSAGGCADLLGLTVLVYKIETNLKNGILHT